MNKISNGEPVIMSLQHLSGLLMFLFLDPIDAMNICDACGCTELKQDWDLWLYEVTYTLQTLFTQRCH